CARDRYDYDESYYAMDYW
nr:immunoglobulin heavy chain junction region [Mus musculus]MBK4184915.1 immunoglobulin heavy chain junction region [Mus musculus]